MSDAARLLVVDRDAGTLDVLSRALERAGYAVDVAQNGLAALQRPQALCPDLILLSSRLAGVDGYRTAKELKESLQSWSIPILLLVPKEESPPGESQTLYGADAYIHTPCPTAGLIEKVEGLLADKHIREQNEAKLRTRLQEHLDGVLEPTLKELMQERTQSLMQQLRAGLIDLVEQEAQEEMRQRIARLAEQEGRTVISEIVTELAGPLVNEVAEDAVSRQVSSVIDEKADALLGRFEQQELPDIADRVVEQAAANRMPSITQDAIQNSKQKIIQELSEHLPKLVEGIAAQALPKLAQQRLGPLIESQLESYLASNLPRRIQSELDREMEGTVKPALHSHLMRTLWVGFGMMVVAATVAIILIKYWPFS